VKLFISHLWRLPVMYYGLIFPALTDRANLFRTFGAFHVVLKIIKNFLQKIMI